jgi:hypothetical protein
MPSKNVHGMYNGRGTEKPLPEDYSIRWIYALADSEFPAAKALLDEIHADILPLERDPNLYVLGRIGVHNVVIDCLPARRTSTNSAAVVVTRVQIRLKSLRVGSFVGVGGGVRSASIRLGDIVVSMAGRGKHSGVLQFDFGRWLSDGILERTGALAGPRETILAAV